MKRYAALFAPEFRLQAVLRHHPELEGRPVALVEAQGAKPVVVEGNAMARTLVVEAGMTPTQALARCAELHLLSPNAGHERSVQEMMLQAGETLSPFLESTAPGVVTIQLPAERSWGEEELAVRVVTPLRAAGLAVRAGVAATPDLALLAARFAAPVRVAGDAAAFLAPLPLGALEPEAELAGVLDSWGIRTIGQFTALPRAEMWERLGPGAVALSERARGDRVRPLRLVRAPEFFSEAADLEHPVEMLEPLLFLLRRFLEQIVARLAGAWFVAGWLRLSLRFEQDEPYRRVFTIPQPTRDVDLLFRLLHTHLENFTAESAIVGVELAARPVRAQVRQIGLLDRGLSDPHQFAETLARLQALLGAGEVGTPRLASSHHPDAFEVRPYDPEAEAAPECARDLLVGVPWLRLRPPVPARIIFDDGGPAFLHSPPSTGPIHETRGPWRLAGQWWQDGWSREEWDIVTADGAYRLVQAGDDWFLEGVYG